MANIQGNRIALEDVLRTMLPSNDEALVQDKLGQNRTPFYVRDFEAGGGWEPIEGEGYEVLILAGDAVQQMGGLPAYVQFGNSGPATPGSMDTTGAIPVLAGTCIPVPQGFRRLWFRASTDVNWRVVISRVPGVHIDYGPYGWTDPPMRVLGATQIESIPVAPAHPVRAIPEAKPELVTDGVAISSRTKELTVHVYAVYGADADPPYVRSRLDLLAGPLEIFWWPAAEAGGVALWSHNGGADDWDAGGLGNAADGHDIERYSCDGASRIYVRDPTGWAYDATGLGMSVGVDIIAYG